MKTKIKMTLLLGVLAALFFIGCVGCGSSKTEPEIIMPQEPMAFSVVEQPQSDASDADGTEAGDAPGSDAAGTDAPGGEAAGTGTQPGPAYTVYLITMDLTDNYWKSIDDGCLKAAEELGNINYVWSGPDEHNDALQSACVDEAVAAGANAVLIAANSADGIDASLQKAEEAGCEIVYVDSAASHGCVAALSTDNTAAGRTAGEAMMDALKEKGITSGKIGIMGVTADTASCVARENGFREAFEGTNFTLDDTVYMADDVANVKIAVQDGILNDYVGFFGTNEGTTAAIGQAVREMAVESMIVGFDTSNEVLSLVSEGVIYATMQQNPETMGYEGLKIAVQALDGTYTDRDVKTDTGVTVITKDVIDAM